MNEPHREKTCLLCLTPGWVKPIHLATKSSKRFKTVDVLDLAIYVMDKNDIISPVVAQKSMHLTLLYDSYKSPSLIG